MAPSFLNAGPVDVDVRPGIQLFAFKADALQANAPAGLTPFLTETSHFLLTGINILASIVRNRFMDIA